MKNLLLALFVILASPFIIALFMLFIAGMTAIMMVTIGFWGWSWITNSPITIIENGQRTGVLVRSKFYPYLDLEE